MTDKPKWSDLFGIAPDLPSDEEPKYTESDMKVLTEVALRLGRKEALEEAELAIKGKLGITSRALSIVHSLASQPSPDATSGRTDPGDPNG